jgi:hypothetical protein
LLFKKPPLTGVRAACRWWTCSGASCPCAPCATAPSTSSSRKVRLPPEGKSAAALRQLVVSQSKAGPEHPAGRVGSRAEPNILRRGSRVRCFAKLDFKCQSPDPSEYSPVPSHVNRTSNTTKTTRLSLLDTSSALVRGSAVRLRAVARRSIVYATTHLLVVRAPLARNTLQCVRARRNLTREREAWWQAKTACCLTRPRSCCIVSWCVTCPPVRLIDCALTREDGGADGGGALAVGRRCLRISPRQTPA